MGPVGIFDFGRRKFMSMKKEEVSGERELELFKERREEAKEKKTFTLGLFQEKEFRSIGPKGRPMILRKKKFVQI